MSPPDVTRNNLLTEKGPGFGFVSCLITLFEHLDGHLLVLGRPNGLPDLTEVTLSQLLVEFELLSGPFPRLHVEQLPLRESEDAFKSHIFNMWAALLRLTADRGVTPPLF